MKTNTYAFLATSVIAMFTGSGCSSNMTKADARTSTNSDDLLFANFKPDHADKRLNRATTAQYGYKFQKAALHRPSTGQEQAQPASVAPDFNTWDRVFQGFELNGHTGNPQVQRFIHYYGQHPEKLTMLSERASVFLHMIVHELDQRNMPTELALLPFVESAFDPDVFSHAGAAGLWQFIPSTGRLYGLQQSSAYDARLDPFAATGAAMDYLQKLNKDFNGDWLLALAAYNCGEGRVQKEIERNRRQGLPTSFWHLTSLPRETREYVPRLLAFKELIGNAQRYGITLPDTPNHARLAFLHVDKPVDLQALAQQVGLDSHQLTHLNPGFRTGIAIPQYSGRIIVPRSHAQQLVDAVNAMPAASVSTRTLARKSSGGYNRLATTRTGKKAHYASNKHKTHTVRKGDTLQTIAMKHGTSVQALMKHNSKRSTTVKVGERISIRA